MSGKDKVFEVSTDVPFSVPSNMDVLVDLPAKHFRANPRIIAASMVGAVVVAAAVAYKVRQDRRKKLEAAKLEADLSPVEESTGSSEESTEQ